ncbi:MAG: alpha/beta hydrolase family esterase [Gemmataceae bacterium]
MSKLVDCTFIPHSTMARLSLVAVTFVCGCNLPYVDGDQFIEHTIRSGGKKRTFYVHKARQKPRRPRPLVVVLHGGGGNGRGLRGTYGFKPFIEKGEFIAVYPNAVGGKWLPTKEEVEFLDAVIDTTFQKENIDRKRLFVTGASRGGVMTLYYLPRTKHDVLAAGSVISGMMKFIADDFSLPRRVDFAFINGTKDPLMPYKGGWGGMWRPKKTGPDEYKLLAVPEAANVLVKANKIKAEPTITSLGNPDLKDGCTNEVQIWADKKTGARVALVTVKGGGHVVPGGRQYLPKAMIGPSCKDFHHAVVMWRFFKKARLRKTR